MRATLRAHRPGHQGRPSPLAWGPSSRRGLLRSAQSGHVGDYVAWIAAGTAALGGILAFSAR